MKLTVISLGLLACCLGVNGFIKNVKPMKIAVVNRISSGSVSLPLSSVPLTSDAELGVTTTDAAVDEEKIRYVRRINKSA